MFLSVFQALPSNLKFPFSKRIYTSDWTSICADLQETCSEEPWQQILETLQELLLRGSLVSQNFQGNTPEKWPRGRGKIKERGSGLRKLCPHLALRAEGGKKSPT